MFKLGVISDTHNYLDPKVHRHFSGVNHIIHAGDIGGSEILSELASIAPVTAVAGNTDDPAWRYPELQTIVLAGRKILIQHIVNPKMMDEDLMLRIKTERPELVIFGHTHKPFYEKIGPVLFFNPGAAGKARFGLERTLAVLQLDEKEIRYRYITL
jgi:putative phosphoesterase